MLSVDLIHESLATQRCVRHDPRLLGAIEAEITSLEKTALRDRSVADTERLADLRAARKRITDGSRYVGTSVSSVSSVRLRLLIWVCSYPHRETRP